MEDLVSMCERRCRKACNLRSAAEDSDEACQSGSSGGRARRYRKRGSPKSAARDAGAMDTDPSPVRLWESEGHSEGYRTAYEPPSESEMSAPISRAHTAPEPALKHDAEGLDVSAASPICSDFQTFCPDWLHFGHFLCFGGIAASQLSLRIFPIYF